MINLLSSFYCDKIVRIIIIRASWRSLERYRFFFNSKYEKRKKIESSVLLFRNYSNRTNNLEIISSYALLGETTLPHVYCTTTSDRSTPFRRRGCRLWCYHDVPINRPFLSEWNLHVFRSSTFVRAFLLLHRIFFFPPFFFFFYDGIRV